MYDQNFTMETGRDVNIANESMSWLTSIKLNWRINGNARICVRFAFVRVCSHGTAIVRMKLHIFKYMHAHDHVHS